MTDSYEVRAQDRLLTQQEVCARLGICVSQLQKMRRTGRIRYLRLGWRSIRFRPEDVEKLIQKQLRAIERVGQLA